MKDYTMFVQTTTGALQWRYDFSMASDRMAIEYASSHTKQFQHVPWFMALILVREDKNLYKFTLKEPEVFAESL